MSLSTETVERLSAIFTPQLRVLCDAFANHGYSVRCIGGAVRDILLGEAAPNDIDLVTDCPGNLLSSVCDACKLKYKVMHGGDNAALTTLIVWIDAQNRSCAQTSELCTAEFELTAVRGNCVTDAEETTDVWREDARRRDFTMNALAVDQHCTVFDYCDGVKHIQQRAVVWAGSSVDSAENAKARMTEAPFRCLRYFRFHGEILERFGKAAQPHEAEVIAAMATNADLLTSVPAEVAWKLLRQIVLSGRHAIDQEMQVMMRAGLLDKLLPTDCNLDLDMETAMLVHDRQHRAATQFEWYHVDPVLTWVVLLKADPKKVAEVWRHLKWSNSDCRVAAFLCDMLTKAWKQSTTREGDSDAWPSLNDCRLLLRDEDRLEPKVAPSKIAILQLIVAQGRLDMLQPIFELEAPVFPAKVTDLQNACKQNDLPLLEGPAIGSALKDLRHKWTMSGCTMDLEQLLDEWLSTFSKDSKE